MLRVSLKNNPSKKTTQKNNNNNKKQTTKTPNRYHVGRSGVGLLHRSARAGWRVAVERQVVVVRVDHFEVVPALEHPPAQPERVQRLPDGEPAAPEPKHFIGGPAIHGAHVQPTCNRRSYIYFKSLIHGVFDSPKQIITTANSGNYIYKELRENYLNKYYWVKSSMLKLMCLKLLNAERFDGI